MKRGAELDEVSDLAAGETDELLTDYDVTVGYHDHIALWQYLHQLQYTSKLTPQHDLQCPN